VLSKFVFGLRLALKKPAFPGTRALKNRTERGSQKLMYMDSNTTQSSSDLPLILLASDEPRLASHLQLALRQQRFAIELAPGYREVESLAQAHESAVVLLEVCRLQSVEAAVEVAMRIKRSNGTRFVGYLADRMLHNSGLTGDGIFPRNAQHLTEALRSHFRKIG
jgi:hypothetical protein